MHARWIGWTGAVGRAASEGASAAVDARPQWLLVRSLQRVCRGVLRGLCIALQRLRDQASQRLSGHVRDGLLADLRVVQPGQAQSDHRADPHLGREHGALIRFRDPQQHEDEAPVSLEAGGQGGRDLRVLVEAAGVQGPKAVRSGLHIAREGEDRSLRCRLDLLLDQAVKVKDLVLHDGSGEGDLGGEVVVEERA